MLILDFSPLKKVKSEAAAQRPQPEVNGKTEFFPRNDRPYGLKYEAFQPENALKDMLLTKQHVLFQGLQSLSSARSGKIRQFFATNTSSSSHCPHLFCNSGKNVSERRQPSHDGVLSLLWYTFHDSEKGVTDVHICKNFDRYFFIFSVSCAHGRPSYRKRRP